jgi:hypothetical protein
VASGYVRGDRTVALGGNERVADQRLVVVALLEHCGAPLGAERAELDEHRGVLVLVGQG